MFSAQAQREAEVGILPTHWRALEAIEASLGDPFDAAVPLSYPRSMHHDETETRPREALEHLQAEGVFDHLVLASRGGRLHSYQHLVCILRLLARRDMTVATYYVLRAIGYGAILVEGSEPQLAHYSEQLLAGNGISWGITEREYGSDLINSGSRAVRDGDGYRLNGAKWLIGMASHCAMTLFLARTEAGASPDSFTLFCLDARQLSPGQMRRLVPEKLHGVRALDLGGFEIDDAYVDEQAVVGEPGKGLELMLRTAQLHRVGVAGMGLGAIDSGLRIALGFATQRRLFGERLADIPITRQELTDTFCDLLLSELTVFAATRSLHFAPRKTFLFAAVSKFVVPSLTRQALSRLSGAIGARYYLRENFMYGAFQKLVRDAEMICFVDGNEKVNLKNIALHMEVTLPYWEKQKPLNEATRTTLAGMFDIFRLEPDAQFHKLSIFSGRDDYVLTFLRDSIDRLAEKLSEMPAVQKNRCDAVLLQCERVVTSFEKLHETLQSWKSELKKDFNYSPQSYYLAEKYALLHSAAIAIHSAVYSDFQAPFDDYAWLCGCLQRVHSRVDYCETLLDQALTGRLFADLESLFEHDRVFSFVPHHCAENSHQYRDPTRLNI